MNSDRISFPFYRATVPDTTLVVDFCPLLNNVTISHDGQDDAVIISYDEWLQLVQYASILRSIAKPRTP